MRYFILKIGTVILAAGICTMGFNYPSMLAADISGAIKPNDKQDQNKKYPEYPLQDLSQNFRLITETEGNPIILEAIRKIKAKFEPYYGMHDVKNIRRGAGQDSDVVYCDLHRNDQIGSGIKKISIDFNMRHLMVIKSDPAIPEIVKAEVRWVDKKGIMIDYMMKDSIIVGSSCYLDVSPLFVAAAINARGGVEKVDVGQFGSAEPVGKVELQRRRLVAPQPE